MRTGRTVSAEMVGDGDDLPKYREQVARLGLMERVRFHPPMPAREAFAPGEDHRRAVAREAMPYIVLEALAAEPDGSGGGGWHSGDIRPRRSPALVAPDAAEIAGKMVQALTEPAAFAALMPSGEELRARFGADVMAARIELSLASIAEERSPRKSCAPNTLILPTFGTRSRLPAGCGRSKDEAR